MSDKVTTETGDDMVPLGAMLSAVERADSARVAHSGAFWRALRR